MSQIKIRVSKIKDIYIGEVSHLGYMQALRINGEIIKGKEFQINEVPVIELCQEIQTPKLMIHKTTGEKLSIEDYSKLSGVSHEYTTHYEYSYVTLETLEYKAVSRVLKLPEFIRSVGAETGDIHNPIVSYSAREVVQTAVQRTLKKRGFYFTENNYSKVPMEYYFYSHDELSFYVNLASGGQIKLEYKISKNNKTLSELLDVEIQVEELYSKTEREVTFRTSENSFNFNTIHYIMNTLEYLEGSLADIESMSKSSSKHQAALSSIRDLIRKLTNQNEKDIAVIKEQIKNERKMNYVDDLN